MLVRFIAVLFSLFAGMLPALSGSAQNKSAPPIPAGTLAYVQEGNIWTTHADGTGKKQLTFSGRDSFPTWSPDSRQLAFIRSDKLAGSPGALYVMEVSSRKPRQLVSGQCRTPLWSPTKDEIAFVRERNDGTVIPGQYLECIPTHATRRVQSRFYLDDRIVDGPTVTELCSWSPDGNSLSVGIMGYLYWEIETIRADQRPLKRFAAYPHQANKDGQVFYYYHGWSPSEPETELLVKNVFTPTASDAETDKCLLVLKAPHARRELLAFPNKIDRAVWSADGKWIAYEEGGTIYLLNIEQPQPHRLTEGTMPRWTR